MVFRVSRVAVVLAASLAVAGAPSALAQPATFSVSRVVAARAVDNGQPIDSATRFPSDVGRIFIWFQATPAPRDITVRTEWYINDAHVNDASFDLTVTQGASTGFFSLALPPGTPFPEGSYRVELTVGGLVLGSHRFEVRNSGAAGPPARRQPSQDSPATSPGPASGSMRAPSGTVLQRPAQGFGVSVPAGWIEKSDSDSAATIVQESQPDVVAMIFVQKEAAPSLVTDVLAKASVRLRNDKTRTLVSSKFDVVLDRPALVAVLEDKTARYKLTLLPRDEEDTSQIFYGVMTAAPSADFAKAEPTLDRIVAGFQVLPMSGSAPGPKGSSAAPAASPAAPSTQAAPGIDRAKAIERILAPKPRSSGQ